MSEDNVNSGDDDNDDDKHDSFRQTRILSIAQDLVYTASGDKITTPSTLEWEVLFTKQHVRRSSLTCFIELVT